MPNTMIQTRRQILKTLLAAGAGIGARAAVTLPWYAAKQAADFVERLAAQQNPAPTPSMTLMQYGGSYNVATLSEALPHFKDYQVNLVISPEGIGHLTSVVWGMDIPILNYYDPEPIAGELGVNVHYLINIGRLEGYFVFEPTEGFAAWPRHGISYDDLYTDYDNLNSYALYDYADFDGAGWLPPLPYWEPSVQDHIINWIAASYHRETSDPVKNFILGDVDVYKYILQSAAFADALEQNPSWRGLTEDSLKVAMVQFIQRIYQDERLIRRFSIDGRVEHLNIILGNGVELANEFPEELGFVTGFFERDVIVSTRLTDSGFDLTYEPDIDRLELLQQVLASGKIVMAVERVIDDDPTLIQNIFAVYAAFGLPAPLIMDRTSSSRNIPEPYLDGSIRQTMEQAQSI
jgi:hypothetical protein